MADGETFDAILREFDRIRLRKDDLPALVISAGAETRFLELLRRLPVGATWRDVIPELPTDWVPGDSGSSPRPYRPLGPYDYQEPPTGPALHVYWSATAAPAPLEAFVAAARNAGWRIHGAGPIPEVNASRGEYHAYLIIDRDAPQDYHWEFVEWFQQRGEPTLAGVARSGDQAYRRSQ